MKISRLFASWHPALVHFPIALLFVAFLFELCSFLARAKVDTTEGAATKDGSWAGPILLTCGTLGLLFAFITGQYAQILDARSGIPQAPINEHEAYATATSWLFIGLLVLRSYVKWANVRMFRVYLVAFFLLLGLLSLTGYRGGQLVYHFAAGIQNVSPPVAATATDLALLTRVQTQAMLDYSNMMHHLFGWFTLALALWLSWQHFDLPGQERAKAFGPIVMTGGGTFLMIFSDWDAWPLANLRPITDPQVLFHKVLATIMIFFGIGMNLARRRESGEVAGLQSHLMALLALIGGGLLFTHAHTEAPYSEAALGVYVQHFAIGIVALVCGGIKMAELIWPDRRRLLNSIWIFLLYVAAMFLITYNEGYPWWAPGDAVPFWTGNQG